MNSLRENKSLDSMMMVTYLELTAETKVRRSKLIVDFRYSF